MSGSGGWKPCVLFLLGGGWKAMCFWWWLEGPWFCYCLLGGVWKARCFETVCCRVVAGSHVFCFCWVVAGKPCVFGGGWKALGFVTVCWVVAGKPGVLRLPVAGWWLESHVFCYCLLGGGWKARCFVSVFWFGWIAMHGWKCTTTAPIAM